MASQNSSVAFESISWRRMDWMRLEEVNDWLIASFLPDMASYSSSELCWFR
ncbi:hypothetical protein Tcan_02518 [Toxocara canis]|uniref:Uncharacterized protein n=1 Tax=Toxocara canis TaxID=6265 RepID=A0A0B2UNT3_TOXCA|nr:hypothetical protein Tcan_02518 [Toxocara canis]